MSPPKTRFIFDVPSSNPAPPSRREPLSCRAVEGEGPPTSRRRASERADTEFGTRLRALAFCAALPFRSIEWLGLVPFTRRSRCLFAAALRCQPPNASNATQCNAIGLHLHLHHPLSHTAQASLTSPASPASPHLPAQLSNVSPFSSVPRLAHFAEKDSLFRDTRQSLACRTHAPSQPLPMNTHVPDLSGPCIVITPGLSIRRFATHDPILFSRSGSPDFSHADAASLCR